MLAQQDPRSVIHSLVLVSVAVLLFVAAASCSNDSNRPRVVTGVVTGVRAVSLDDVVSFTLKSGDETHEVFIDPDARYAFPPSHLRSHMAGGEPVRAEVEERDGRLYAVTLADAE